ncbi:hypothetical protein BCR34DRAFT_38673 [Clohesyomyces aquaticus]|uniref:Transcription factor BYE1 n=1 Tax=Clohesyomyces aquaticus TaxID=1231657 RepID=A0A1Y2A4K9_9PLEO|nr:hypothetical protein BCR34DRAFT_38673 [Clohesyomyces aquaticus]
MADEVRRSGRANKGHHTKNQDILEEPLTKSKPKPKDSKKSQTPAQSQTGRSQSAQSGEEKEEDDAIIRCVCGDQRDIRGRQMICCETCEAWQHVKCLGLQEGKQWEEEDRKYFCEQCRPEDHVDLLAAMARGEKPWNRKKGSKQAKPKARPSDVGSVTDETKRISTPAKPTPPVATAPPPPAVQDLPLVEDTTNVPAKDTPPVEISNGHTEPAESTAETTAEMAPRKKATPKPKSQPQSPIGEKRRRDTISDKDGADTTKRRKSSSQHPNNNNKNATNKSPQEPTMASHVKELPEKQKASVEAFIKSFAPLVKEASQSRGYRISDGDTPSSISTRLGLQLDLAILVRYGDPTDNSSTYIDKFRSILFNIKQNKSLVDRLLSGSLSPEEFASMTPEAMASEEKQQEFAAIREANDKQMILLEETGPRLRKTHKGEELVGGEEDAVGHEFVPPPRHHRDSVQEEQKNTEPQSPKREGSPNIVELPEDVGRHPPLAVDTSNAQPTPVRRASTNFDINSVFDKVRSPQNNQHAFQRRQSSIVVQDTPPEGPGDDADVDRLLKDDDNDVAMTDYNSDPTVAWKGTLDMQALGPFEAVARFVAGGDFGQVLPWKELLAPNLPISGRIESARGNDYINGLAHSDSYDVAVLSVTPLNEEGRATMDRLFNYFHPRDRWGVVPVEKLGNEKDFMRDLYVIPVEAGGSNLPPFLEMLEYCTIETPRPNHTILLALIARLPDATLVPYTQHPGPAVGGNSFATNPQATPTGERNGPSPLTGTNPHGPAISPIMPNFPPAPNYGSPYALSHQNNGFAPQVPSMSANAPPPHHKIPMAVDILGPYIDAPTAVMVLSAGVSGNDAEKILGNLRAIFEDEPQSRTDINVLTQHLAIKNAQTGAPQPFS